MNMGASWPPESSATYSENSTPTTAILMDVKPMRRANRECNSVMRGGLPLKKVQSTQKRPLHKQKHVRPCQWKSC